MYDDYNEIITIEELAAILRIGMNSAYKLVHSGEISSFRVNNSHRIQRSAVTDFIISRSTSYSRLRRLLSEQCYT
ncbi:hypothetical protein Back11_39570 [Paenibacillus baekrokdamisoli]|uniref:Helix-turn-helix domain-containing protein n=1 Tax=Paenibacillus baekrokdamisoli TaxID=1712516 RepID=A0A3G9IWE3_9BACL|nr:helix-turn-helix domain-containing protein [Paenibacillus baekrokdamisoli]MBB3068346.1 excisionase family DNA binding protein [Paenibacillus baekrokdamisoli]BBH22612.1 hypothetical protein Back11_39570 [Paenibacillus baekrokdamisoli]